MITDLIVSWNIRHKKLQFTLSYEWSFLKPQQYKFTESFMLKYNIKFLFRIYRKGISKIYSIVEGHFRHFFTNKVQENVYCLIEFKRWDAGTKYLGDISNNFQ